VPALNVSIYEIVFGIFAKSKCRIQIIKHTWTQARNQREAIALPEIFTNVCIC